jgi:hypothetical protein
MDFDANIVIAGLDPAIHLLEESFSMDARAFAAPKGLRPRRRVEPAHDDSKRGHLTMTFMQKYRSQLSAATFALLATLALASPARADGCEDIANQLKGQIDGLKVGITAARVTYLSHPDAKEMSLGCRGREYSNELYAKADSRKPKPAFFDLVARASAIVFTVTIDDTTRGVTRCINRMGIFRGDNVKIRYRRLDMVCNRTKTEAAIAISRRKEE